MPDWNSIDTVLLDMDGTLLDLHFDNHFWQQHVIERYAELHGVPLEEARPRLQQRMQETRGSLNWYCLDFWSRELQLDIVALKREVEHLISPHPHAEDFLRALRGWRATALVTNAHPDSLQLKLQRTGIGVYFDHIVSAHEFTLPKEELQFWQKLQQQLQFNPQRTLLVEDNVAILRTAQQFGIAHLLAITRPDSRGGRIAADGFDAVDHFGELLPIPKD